MTIRIEKLELYRKKWLISREPNALGQYDLYEFSPVYVNGRLISSVGKFRLFADIDTIDKKITQWEAEQWT